jgi:hypothetical protein
MTCISGFASTPAVVMLHVNVSTSTLWHSHIEDIFEPPSCILREIKKEYKELPNSWNTASSVAIGVTLEFDDLLLEGFLTILQACAKHHYGFQVGQILMIYVLIRSAVFI